MSKISKKQHKIKKNKSKNLLKDKRKIITTTKKKVAHTIADVVLQDASISNCSVLEKPQMSETDETLTWEDINEEKLQKIKKIKSKKLKKAILKNKRPSTSEPSKDTAINKLEAVNESKGKKRAENDEVLELLSETYKGPDTPPESETIEKLISETKNEEKVERKRIIKGKAEHRSEPSQNISEFHLTEVGKEKVKLDELIKTSQKSGQLSVKKQLQNANKLKSLSIPLSKPQLEKIKRTVAYDKVCSEVSKWDTIVKSNRDAEQVIFPLKRPEFHLDSFETVSERYISKHPVEEAIDKILKTSEHVLDQQRTLTEAEEKALQAMSVEEAKLRHNELMKHRALLSYQEARARRQNKIKSKRYHRILKREKLKKMMKEFEELQKTDETAAIEKFLEADKLRILERMTLRHRNTGKWAKLQKIRSKYNPECRSNLKEDLLIGKQLREKIAAEIPSQQRIENDEIDPEDNFFEDSSETFLIEDVPFTSNTAEKAMSTLENFVKSQAEEKIKSKMESQEKVSKIKERSSKQPFKVSTVEDEMAFSSEAICLNSLVPDDVTFGDEDLDDKDDDKITINQAFADEEFIAEFQEEKKVADRANRPDGLDLYLPGWGNWGGPGIKTSKKKRRRFFIKPLEPQPKKNTLGNVIINEEKDKKASEHQVSSLPFPFSNVHQFESYIRQPIGHTWNPQSSFQNLIAPKVVTKMGKIIDPIDKDDVVLEKKEQNKPMKKKKMKKQKELKAF